MKDLFCALVIFVVGVGCGDGEPSDTCVFDGRYDTGVDWSSPDYDPACGLFYSTNTFNAQESECSSQFVLRNLDGAAVLSTVVCEPGSPVVECAGTVSDSDGCWWPVYVRRIEQ